MVCFKPVMVLLIHAMALAQELPAGTVIPVMIGSSLNAKKDHVGKKLEGRVMQEVPLPYGRRINERSRITAHVVSYEARIVGLSHCCEVRHNSRRWTQDPSNGGVAGFGFYAAHLARRKFGTDKAHTESRGRMSWWTRLRPRTSDLDIFEHGLRCVQGG
jgi:hypothetical protein